MKKRTSLKNFNRVDLKEYYQNEVIVLGINSIKVISRDFIGDYIYNINLFPFLG